jgi:hypothetical protein
LLGAEQRFAMAPELAPLKPHFDAEEAGLAAQRRHR